MYTAAMGRRIFWGFAGAFVLLACGVTSGKIDEGLVIATIRPYALIAGEIAGDRLRVETLLPASASVHTWSPRPGDLTRLAKAGLVIANGLNLEIQLNSFLTRLGGRVVRAADVLGIYSNAGARDADHHHAEDDVYDVYDVRDDPHLWTDPALMIRFAGKLAGHFAFLDKEGEAAYMHNYARFSNDLFILDANIRAEAGQYSRRSLITFHDAFIRFFERYGITRVAAIVPVPGRDPSAARLAELGDMIRRHDVRAIYSEPQLDPKGARLLAKEYNLPIYVLDPLGADVSITRYSAFLARNWQEMQKGFAR